MPKTYALTYCPCGQVSVGAGWKHPVISLAEFLSHMRRKQITLVRLVSLSCPDCFQAKLDSVDATVETAATDKLTQPIDV